MSLLSRRDERTQPGVLTPGNPKKKVPPRRGGRRFLTIGPLINETANRYLPPLSSFVPFSRTTADRQGGWSSDRYPGLKPRAESFRPFGTKIKTGQIRNSISPTLHYSTRQNSRTRTTTSTITTTRRRTPNAKPQAPNACTP